MKSSRESDLARVDGLPSKYKEIKKGQKSREHMKGNEYNDQSLGNKCLIGKKKEKQRGKGQSVDWRS